jgi:glycosyltransferase involved in cell wall biosynthesis
MPKLSIIVPVYNERSTVAELLRRALSVEIDKEIIVVDDGSTDGTREFLHGYNHESVTVVMHPENLGKGAAVRTGLERAGGEYVVVQDADLEYDPSQMPRLVEPLERGECDAVYGNRFPWLEKHDLRGVHILTFMANQLLSWLVTILFVQRIHDVETCHKVMKTDTAQSLGLRSSGFDIEPEITAKLLKRGYRIKEVPIAYSYRRYSEGKKITWRDGIVAFLTAIKYRFVD